MRTALVLAAGIALAATSAWGQSSWRDRDDFNRGDWREHRGGWDRDQDHGRGQAMRRDDDDNRSGRDDDGDRSGSGARFFLRSGDTQLRIVCGDRESTQTCVDAALRMFDRVQSQQGPAARSPSTPPTPSAPQ